MKKHLSLILAGALCLALITGCGGTQQPASSGSQPENTSQPAQTPAPGGKTQRLILGSGPIGGAFYPIAGGIAAIINENVEGVSVSVQVTGGGIENTRLVGTGEIDMGMCAADQTYNAVNHSGMFANDNLDLKTLGTLHASAQQIITLKKSGLKEFEDLKGKKVAIGEPGGGSEVAFKEALAALGWAESDVEMIYLPYDQAMDQLADGLLDAACVYAGMPAPTVTALATKMDVNMINTSDDLIAKMSAANSLYSYETIPAGSYAGMDEDIVTPVQRIMLTCSTTMDEETAYQITKAVYEHLDQLATYHAAAKSISLEAAPQTTAPLNEGAKKFFTEAGVLK